MSRSTEKDVKLDRLVGVLFDWGITLDGESEHLDDGDDFAEAIREDGAWRFVRDLRAALSIPPGGSSNE